MKKLTFLLLLLAPVIAFSQEKGIQFVHGLTWEQVKEKAKAENKYIFVDCFTTWCGPCKFMSSTIFPLEDVGNYFNDRFISVKLQLDKTEGDNDEVKSWYATGESIAKEYSVNAYPTFLFFNPQGEAVHRVVGGAEDGPGWLKRVTPVFDPEQQYYTLIKQYEKGNKAPEFLKRASLAAIGAYDAKNAAALSKAYLATQKDLYTKDNLEYISKFTRSSKDEGFALLLKNSKKANAALGEGKAEKIVKGIILQEEVFGKVFRNKDQKPDWNAVSADLKQKYPAFAEEVAAEGKVVYFQYTKDWENFAPAVMSYMKKYGAGVAPEALNDFAWTVFENCKDMTCVTEALEWSKRSLEGNNNPMFMDTYANILYRMGKKDEAITWEEKALSLVSEGGEKKAYTETLDKMKKGEKTWKD
ncbi:thioredoxin fold domain-containing protein [Chitinophaga sp. 22620]|uniref:thioredoxin family protein n=1 Tax=Chitinophaga sp. 22620 TaxID=3453952 RepID=UPI003F8523DE